jgi:hypothetical protein
VWYRNGNGDGLGNGYWTRYDNRNVAGHSYGYRSRHWYRHWTWDWDSDGLWYGDGDGTVDGHRNRLRHWHRDGSVDGGDCVEAASDHSQTAA